MERMVGHYVTLLEAALATPERPISELTMLTADELAAIEPPSTPPTPTTTATLCVHDLVAAQAHRTPDATAVTFDDRSLTYGELDVRANQLAHHLIDLGVAPGTVVGIHLERSPEMVVAAARHPQGGRRLPARSIPASRRPARVHAADSAHRRW